MRYTKDHKDASRQRLIELSGSHAKKHGFNDSGMASLAASAGVTTGALVQALRWQGRSVRGADHGRARAHGEGCTTASTQPPMSSAAKSLAGYLSLQHVTHPEQGCPLPSLTPEIARADDAAQAAYQAGLLEIHAKLRRLTATSEDAWTLMAQNVGAVMLARASPRRRAPAGDPGGPASGGREVAC
jgi:TetR/AcrR family transcriptional repressor of nem operon